MSISKKHSKFLDEYLLDFNATQAYIRAGYSKNGAKQSASRLLTNADLRAELQKRFEACRMNTDEIISRLEGMATGMIPTKIIERPSRTYGKPVLHREFDMKGSLENLSKVYALFVDKQVVENIGLEIIDDESP